MLVVESAPDVGPVLGPVRRELAVQTAEELEDVRRQRIEHTGQPPLVVEDALGEHQPRDEVGAALGDQETHRRPDRVPDQMRGAADVGCAPLPAAVEAIGAKALAEAGQVHVPGARVGSTGMEQHERLTYAVDVPPGVDVACPDVGAHGRGRGGV